MAINLTVSQPSAVALNFVEAKIKPETVGHVTPTYEQQTVYPASGTVFGSVEVDAIPDPTAVKEIDSNGDHDVRRYGTARVDVQPDLQDKTVTPTKQKQTVQASENHYGLDTVTVNPIPSEYIIPTGSQNITQNGQDIDIADKATVNVNVQPNLQIGEATPNDQTQTITPDEQHDGFSSFQVNPIPSQYIVPTGTKQITQNGTGIDVLQYATADIAVPMPEEYAVGGSKYGKTLVKYHFSPNISSAVVFQNSEFDGCSDLEEFENFPPVVDLPYYFCRNDRKLKPTFVLPEGTKTTQWQCFMNCELLDWETLPSTFTRLRSSTFQGCTALRLKELPSSLIELSGYVFQDCPNITIKTIPVGVKTIGDCCFNNCTGITEQTYLADMTSIGALVYRNCTNCLKYDFRNNTAVPTMNNSNAFQNINANAKIVVPDALVSTWKAATNWVTYADHIIGVSDYDNS